MKKKLILILALLVCTYSYSQIRFEKGYYINNDDEKINCFIKNIDWRSNPTKFDFKLTEQSDSKKLNINLVKEFGINNTSKYIRCTVNIDRSTENVNKLSNDKNPIFTKEQLFLKVLIEGKNALYEYIDNNLKRFFFKNSNLSIEQLVFKTYSTASGNYYGENNLFRQQLLNNLKCPKFTSNRFKNLKYKKKELLDLFIDYNECFNKTDTNFETTKKRDIFNLNIRPRLVSTSLEINSIFEFRNADFGNKTVFGIGVEAEFILPFNKNKWAIIIEPTYQNLKTETTVNTRTFFGGELTTIINYKTIEFPVGVRHYLFLSNNSKLFINASYVTGFTLNSTSEYERKDGFDLEPLEIKSRDNLAFGFGYNYRDSYSLELRYQTNRDIFSDDVTVKTGYNSFSIILGYSFF
ncbi:outer membrane beta-barrel protein [uncultured Polaribacter sp.]|uniref:outer membrane beta-barrel protein n=1 Tax=uncultured Polaribacter sp. TaxID=174711 RepID=UPI00262C00FC|nr:outer membrane beta-barrel protein [uncultured Polaribacter sp.]